MNGDGDWGVTGFGGGLGVDGEGEGGSRHHREGLMLADVERTCCIVVQQVMLKPAAVLLRRREWQGCGYLRGVLSWGKSKVCLVVGSVFSALEGCGGPRW